MPNFYKRPMNQAPNRMLSMGAKMMDKNMKSDKENLNEIIYRKCQYISQKWIDLFNIFQTAINN